MPSSHLQFANQTYFEHLKDSMKYSWKSFKSCFYFFIHGIIPDVYTDAGSVEIHELDIMIQNKYELLSPTPIDLFCNEV
jgi:hypothetical protein